jgi:transcription initiation factor TFIIIB Brf1 subunit/transcription initiation factor TFIIB
VDCGLVVEEEEIDHGPGWRAFDSRERDEKSRVGARSSNLPAMRTSSLYGAATTNFWMLALT